jgi:hypothetical protein
MFRFAILAGAATALVLSATASAKLTSMSVSSQAAPRTHVPWTITVRVSLRGKPYAKPDYRPTVYLLANGGIMPVATFRGVRVGAGLFQVKVVFPRPGVWRYGIPDPVNGEWFFMSPRVAA